MHILGYVAAYRSLYHSHLAVLMQRKVSSYKMNVCLIHSSYAMLIVAKKKLYTWTGHAMFGMHNYIFYSVSEMALIFFCMVLGQKEFFLISFAPLNFLHISKS